MMNNRPTSNKQPSFNCQNESSFELLLLLCFFIMAIILVFNFLNVSDIEFYLVLFCEMQHYGICCYYAEPGQV